MIVAAKFSLRNTTDQSQTVLALNCRTNLGGAMGQVMTDIEVLRESARIQQGLPRMQSQIGPGDMQTFWMVNAFPWNAWGGEPEYAVLVSDAVMNEYGVTRIGGNPKKYWKSETLFGTGKPEPDEAPGREV